MRRLSIAVVILAVASVLGAIAFAGGLKKLGVLTGIIKPGPAPDGQSILLPNKWRITPAGRQITLPGDMIMKIIVSADGKTLIANSAGYHDHSVSLIDVENNKLSQSVNVAKIWTGMAVNASTGDIYVSGGGPLTRQFLDRGKNAQIDQQILEASRLPVLRLKTENGKLTLRKSIAIDGLTDKDRFVAGLTCSSDGALYVVNTQNDSVYRLSGTDFKTQVVGRVGYRPYAAVLSLDGKQLAVSNWGDESVSILDANTLAEASRIKVGSHPNDLAFAKDGRLLSPTPVPTASA